MYDLSAYEKNNSPIYVRFLIMKNLKILRKISGFKTSTISRIVRSPPHLIIYYSEIYEPISFKNVIERNIYIKTYVLYICEFSFVSFIFFLL